MAPVKLLCLFLTASIEILVGYVSHGRCFMVAFGSRKINRSGLGTTEVNSEKQMPWLARLADRLILCPTTEPVDSGELSRELIPSTSGHIEAWTCQSVSANASRQIALIKFPGNGGRAENSTPNPAHLWEDSQSEIWTINPFGYGGSSGEASLQRIPEMVDAVFNRVRTRFPDHKIVVYGNSLGSISALMLAARFRVDGLYLRNPVPIHQLISTRMRYVLPSLGLSRLLANQISETLDAVTNAKKIQQPCLFVTSEKDRLIPPGFQDKIIAPYSGDKRVFVIPDADHHDPVPEELEREYRTAINWLYEKIFFKNGTP